MATCIKFYFFLLLLLGLFYGFGHFIWRPFEKSVEVKGFHLSLFVKLLFGITVSVLLYSVYITGFKTVNLAFVLLLLFLYIELLRNRNKNGLYPLKAFENGNNKHNILFLALASILLFSWFAYLIIDPGSEFGFFLPDKGKVYYAGVADMLSTGQENRWNVNNVIDDYYKGTTPYHYFELWLANMFSRVTGAPTILSLYFFVYPCLTLISLTGILALMEKTGRLNWVKRVSALLLLFVSGFYFSFTPEFRWALNFGESPMECMGEKYSAYYPFIIFAFLLFMDGLTVAGLTVLLFLPVVSISTLPGIFASVVIFCTIFWFIRRNLRKELLRPVFYVAPLALFLFGSYKLFGFRENPYLAGGILHYTDLTGFSFHSVKVFLVELAYRIYDCPLRSFLIHLAFLPLVIIALQRQLSGFRRLLLFSCILYFTSLFLYGIFYKLFDGIQFYTNDFAFVNVFLIFSFVLCLSGERSVLKTMLTSTILLLLCYKVYFSFSMHGINRTDNQVYSSAYLSAIEKEEESLKERQLVGAFFGGREDEQNFYHDDKSGVSCSYLTFLNGFYPAVDLSVFNIVAWSGESEVAELQRSVVRQSPFYRFVEAQRNAGKFQSIEQSQLDFIKEKQIHYLVLSKLAKPNPLLDTLVKREIKDSRSGERFVFLQY